MRFDVTDRVPATAELAEEARAAFRGLWEAVFPEPGSVLICPVGRRAGATTVACGLALAGVADARGRKAAVVDFNLRRPGLQRCLGLADGPGLAEVLTGRVPLPEALQRVGPDDLDVLTAGEAAEVAAGDVGGAATESTLAELRQWYDYVIVDGPAVGRYPDAEALAAFAVPAVLVARAGRTSGPSVSAARRRLEAAGGRVLGVVLNGCAGSGSG